LAVIKSYNKYYKQDDIEAGNVMLKVLLCIAQLGDKGKFGKMISITHFFYKLLGYYHKSSCYPVQFLP